MSALRRVRAGQFSLENAYTLEQVQQAADAGRAEELLLPVDALFSEYPAVALTAKGEKRCRVGNDYPVPETAGGICRVYGGDGTFLALARAEQGTGKTIKSFYEV